MSDRVGPRWRHGLAALLTAAGVAAGGTAVLANPEDFMVPGPESASGTAGLLAEATAMIEGGQYEDARLALGALLAEEPDTAEAWNQLGYLERRLQNFDLALDHYAKALALDPVHIGALHYQGETFLALGRVAEAEANLARIEEVCDFPCEDGDDLAEQIALFRKNLDG